MNAKSIISGIALLASASALPFSAACASTLITFDDLPPTRAPFFSRAIANGYQGLDWTNFQHTDPVALLAFGFPAQGYINGIVSPRNVALNAAGDPASFSSASAFTLGSLYLTSAWNDGLNILIEGRNGGTVVFSRNVVANTSGPIFSVFNWSGIDTVRFVSSGGTNAKFGGVGTHFALDNVTIGRVGVIPEPSTWMLMILGFGLIAQQLRRRHQAAFAH